MCGGWMYACVSECTWVTDTCCYCCSVAVLFNSLWPHGLQPDRLLCSWVSQERILERVANVHHMPPKIKVFQRIPHCNIFMAFFLHLTFSINRSRWLKTLISFFFIILYTFDYIKNFKGFVPISIGMFWGSRQAQVHYDAWVCNKNREVFLDIQSEDLPIDQFGSIPYFCPIWMRFGRLHKLPTFHAKNVKLQSMIPLADINDAKFTGWISDHPRDNW